MRFKIPSLLTLLAFCVAFLGTSCSTQQITSSLPTVKVAAAAGTTLGLKAGKATQSQINQVYTLGKALYSVTGGNVVPTVAMMETAIAQYVTDPVASEIGDLATAIYQQYYPKLTGNVALACQVVNAIAGGIEDGAASAGAVTSTAVAKRFYEKCIRARLAKINVGPGSHLHAS